jgi:hypothetical protein
MDNVQNCDSCILIFTAVAKQLWLKQRLSGEETAGCSVHSEEQQLQISDRPTAVEPIMSYR